MTLGLLTLHFIFVAVTGLSVFYGVLISEGGGAFGHHITLALASTLLGVFTHTMTYFYFVGMGSNLKRTVEEHNQGHEHLAASKKLKVKVFPWAFGGMALLMTTFVLGGGAHTNAFPSIIHKIPGYLVLAYSCIALFAEGYYLLKQNTLVNLFQMELSNSKERLTKTKS